MQQTHRPLQDSTLTTEAADKQQNTVPLPWILSHHLLWPAFPLYQLLNILAISSP